MRKIDWDEAFKNVDPDTKEHKKIKVIIEERIVREMYIEAADDEEAMEIAEELYYNGEFAPDCEGSIGGKSISVYDGEFWTDWTEF